MSIITTTRAFQSGDQFTFTVAAKNGYGINYLEIPSMSEYLAEDTEVIEPIGTVFDGNYNGDLYPGVRVSGMLENTSVNYEVLLENNGCVRQLTYRVKFDSDINPISGNTVQIRLEGIPDNLIDPYIWSTEPLVLQTPEIIRTEPESDDIIFTVWHCIDNNTDYAPGSRVYISDDVAFLAKWAIAPVNVSIENDTDNTNTPEFENE